MAVTYKLIETITVGSGGAANIEFTSIPQTYTDLNLVFSLRSTTTTDFITLYFNTTSVGFTYRRVTGDGSGAGGNTGTSAVVGTQTISTYTASVFANSALYIPNYAGSTNKSWSLDTVLENNATATQMNLIAGLWSNTAAITGIKIEAPAGSIAQYSSASLYGIKNS
jgi:hypothetical protein